MELRIKEHVVIVDDEDASKVSSLKWYVQYGYGKKQGEIYFYHSLPLPNNKKYNVSLQRYIMGCNQNDGFVVDHINGNTLDNRKSNLRICSRAENTMNQKRSCDNTSGYKGVCYNKRAKRYRVRISINNKRISLGYYKTLEEAHAAYCEASKKYHGEFGRIS